MTNREGNLQAPTRHPLDWRNPEFYDEGALEQEMERVFDICHGCRRCVSLCQSFPTLFDLVDESKTMEVDGVAKADYVEGRRPVLSVRRLLHDEVPVRAAAPVERRFPAPDAAREGGRVQEGRDAVPRPAADEHRPRRPARDDPGRRADGQQGERDAVRAQGDGQGARRRGRGEAAAVRSARRFARRRDASIAWPVRDGARTPGKVAIFATCYVNYNEPGIGHDLLQILAHNEVPYTVVEKEACCGMPKLELGDLEAVEKLKNVNIPAARGAGARRLRDPDGGARRAR